MNNNAQELSRMKALMTYGLQTEGKKQYSSVEYSKEASDGKVYGIVREGTKYYIKVAKNKKNLVKENFDYIGGFMNRKDNEYSSYANALKQFDLKMMSLKEANANGKNIIIESWNPDKNEILAEESTSKMRNEIMRQRQIMGNAKLINEGKDGEYNCPGGNAFCIDPSKEYKENEKDNVNREYKEVRGKGAKKSMNEKSEVLGWHKSGGNAQETIADTYLDTSHGTEIGDGAPFDKCPKSETDTEMSNGVVEEHNSSMVYDGDENQNTPEVGVGPIGDKQPFDGEKGRQIDEAIDDFEDDLIGDDSYDSEYATEGGDTEPYDDLDDSEYATEDGDTEPYDDLDDEELGDDELGDDSTEYELETDGEDGDVDARLSAIEAALDDISRKISDLDSSDFDDDDLYPEDDEDDLEDDALGDDDFEGEESDFDGEGADFDGEGADFDGEGEEDNEPTEIYESRAFRKMRLKEEQRLDYFGKHPAYRKVPMQLPQTGEDKNKHGRDWNDSSVHSEAPYGEKIGSGKPFDIDPQDIENSIAECVRKILKKK